MSCPRRVESWPIQHFSASRVSQTGGHSDALDEADLACIWRKAVTHENGVVEIENEKLLARSRLVHDVDLQFVAGLE